MVEIEAGAPLTGPAGYHGSVVVFWPVGLASGLVFRERPVLGGWVGPPGRRPPATGEHLVRPGDGGDGTELVLDAGTGIRELGGPRRDIPAGPHPPDPPPPRPHPGAPVLRAPVRPEREGHVWAPPAASPRSASASPATCPPPCRRSSTREPRHGLFEDSSEGPWRIGSLEVEAALVSHRGPTLGYRLGGRCLAGVPARPRARARHVARRHPQGLGLGFGLASRTSVLIHDAQYTEREYQTHVGWATRARPTPSSMRAVRRPTRSC